jgi:ORF6N domain-containing protein
MRQLEGAHPALASGDPIVLIERRIYFIRGQKVILDKDLAELYQVSTSQLNQAVKRNRKRFPADFMFQLKPAEVSLLSQSVISNPGRGGRRTAPNAFTEHGVAMLSSALNSERAIQMNILIVRAFIRIRELLASHEELAARMEKVEAAQREHSSIIGILAEEIDDLKGLPEPAKRPIGFRPDPESHSNRYGHELLQAGYG